MNGRKIKHYISGSLLIVFFIACQVYLFVGNFISRGDFDGWGRQASPILDKSVWIFEILGITPLWSGWKWFIFDSFVGFISIIIFAIGGSKLFGENKYVQNASMD